MYTTTAPQTTSGGSNSNSDSSNGEFKRQVEAFEVPNRHESAKQVASNDFTQQVGVGVGLYFTLLLFTVAFMKKKKII